MALATVTSTRGRGLSLLVLWLDLVVFATCQSATPSGLDGSLPDEGNVQSFADTDETTSAPPPPYGSNHGYENTGRTPNGLEILVAIFFFVAAAWLLVAVFYALLALLVLRLRAQGRLDMNDEDFGIFYICGTQLYFPCGCILRRYIIAFGHDQQSRQNRPADNRCISRSERRSAIEAILLGRGTRNFANIKREPRIDEKMGSLSQRSDTSDSSNDAEKIPQANESHCVSCDHSHSQSSEEPVCSICLAEYKNDDNVFHSDICDHMYHSTCILDWLERRSNRDCPCCRQPLVSEDAVWETVKVARKVQKTQGKKVKRKNRRWRFASLTSETNVASSSNGAPEREASNESNPRREGQHSLSTSPPSTGDESGHDLTTTENGECGHDDDSANRSLQDQSGFHQSTLEKTQEHAIAMGDQSPLDEEMGISNVEVPLFATAGDELTEGCSVAGDADEGKRE